MANEKGRYTARVRVGVIEFELGGDREFVEKYISKWKEELLKDKNLGAGGLGTMVNRIPVSGKAVEGDLSEFYSHKKPQTQNETIAVFGYYFENKENKREFNHKDLLQAFDKVRISRPKNIHDTLKKCYKRTPYILPVEDKEGKKGYWRLHSSGISFVESLPRKTEKK